MAQTTTYDPYSPEVVKFLAELDGLSLSARNLLLNYPWPEGWDSPLVLQLKTRWRALRALPEQPFNTT